MRRSPKQPDSGPARPDAPEPEGPELADAVPTPVAAAALGSLSDLPVAGLTRRRIALLIGALVAAWVIVLFARQVGEASEATARAEAMAAHNAQLTTDVAALERELGLIQRQSYVAQAARGYRLGSPNEIPFTLAEDAPPLPADAPGSASTRLGTAADRERPIDAWARLLFGDAGN
jgi:cell division protein FtsB